MTGALIYYMCLVYLFGTPLRNLATLSFNHIFVVTLSVVCGELRDRDRDRDRERERERETETDRDRDRESWIIETKLESIVKIKGSSFCYYISF